MSEEKKPIKIEFAPGCFDTFTGTQEELDGLLAEIQRMVESGEAFEKSTPLDIDAMMEDDPEMAEHIIRSLMAEDDDTPKRNLQ